MLRICYFVGFDVFKFVLLVVIIFGCRQADANSFFEIIGGICIDDKMLFLIGRVSFASVAFFWCLFFESSNISFRFGWYFL